MSLTITTAIKKTLKLVSAAVWTPPWTSRPYNSKICPLTYFSATLTSSYSTTVPVSAPCLIFPQDLQKCNTSLSDLLCTINIFNTNVASVADYLEVKSYCLQMLTSALSLASSALSPTSLYGWSMHLHCSCFRSSHLLCLKIKRLTFPYSSGTLPLSILLKDHQKLSSYLFQWLLISTDLLLGPTTFLPFHVLLSPPFRWSCFWTPGNLGL